LEARRSEGRSEARSEAGESNLATKRRKKHKVSFLMPEVFVSYPVSIADRSILLSWF
jgi:hypothetical protein